MACGACGELKGRPREKEIWRAVLVGNLRAGRGGKKYGVWPAAWYLRGATLVRAPLTYVFQAHAIFLSYRELE